MLGQSASNDWADHCRDAKSGCEDPGAHWGCHRSNTSFDYIRTVSLGLIDGGAENVTMINAPGKMPAAPMPATARPMIRTIEDEAVAQIKLPISKRPRNTRYAPFNGKNSKTFPVRGWQAQLRLYQSSWLPGGNEKPYIVKRKALPYHPTSRREWKSSVIVCIA